MLNGLRKNSGPAGEVGAKEAAEKPAKLMRVREKVGFRKIWDWQLPQGLKPEPFLIVYGPTKVVPDTKQSFSREVVP